MPERGHMEHEIRKALRENERTASLELKVKFIGGVVFLDGTVPSAELREAAAEVARGVQGVTLVHNRLQIKPETHTSREQFREGERR